MINLQTMTSLLSFLFFFNLPYPLCSFLLTSLSQLLLLFKCKEKLAMNQPLTLTIALPNCVNMANSIL